VPALLNEGRESQEAKMKGNYKQKFDKLTFTLAIPVDENMKRISAEAKKRKFKFNEWARDVLYARIQDVVKECGIDSPEADQS
jgi:hypothetical protein